MKTCPCNQRDPARIGFYGLKWPKSQHRLNISFIYITLGFLRQTLFPNGNPLRKGERIIDSFCYIIGLKGKAKIHIDDLIPKTSVVEISTPWPFRYLHQ